MSKKEAVSASFFVLNTVRRLHKRDKVVYNTMNLYE